jgi:hypothetical protein
LIDLRYHVYSLVAVFLALAIGILIGASISGGLTGNEAISRQSRAIERLNREFRAHQATLAEKQSALDAATRQLRQADGLLAGLYAPLLQGRLAGRGVAIVQLGQGEEVAASVKSALQQAGAAVNSVTRLDTDYGFGDSEKMKKAARAIPLEFQAAGKEPYQQIWGYVSTVLSAGRPGRPFETLASVGLLQGEGDYSRPNRFVVIVFPKGADPVTLKDLVVQPLLGKLKDAGLSAAVASAAAGGQTPPDFWSQFDVPTVSHADMAFGRLCLVEALVRGEGHYGLGPTEEFLPGRLTAR